MSEDNSAHVTDPDTLEEIMDVRSAMEFAGSGGEVERLTKENRKRMSDTETKIANAFESGDVETAKRETVRLKYLVSLQEGLSNWEEGKAPEAAVLHH
jgi:molecular chaperone HscB